MWGALLALGMPGVAQAMQMQYVTHNAFNDTVQAFQRLALIASDSVFLLIAGCMVAGSIVFSSMYFAAEGMAQKANNPMGFLITGAAGLVLFFGAVVPKGTVYVYDDVLNKTQAVGGVPDLVVLVAGTLNAIEREIVRVTDTAAATPYSADFGAGTYQILYNLAKSNQADVDLERSIGQYVKDCGLTAIGVGQNGATMTELLRASEDLKETLAKYSHPSWPTVWYPAGNSGGVPGVCAEAWTYISGQLESTSPTRPAAVLGKRACLEAGYDTSDAVQAAHCDSLSLTAAKLFGIEPASSTVFVNNFVIAKGMTTMLMSSDFGQSQTMLANRSMVAEGLGAAEIFNQWVPRLRALLLAVVLGMLPVPLLFIATHLVYKAAGLVIGLFVFLTLWGVADAASVQMARDAAATAFALIKEQHVGYESMMLVPSASMQSLALFGKYRMMAMGMAGVLSATLFKLAASGFTRAAEAAGNDVTTKGTDAGTRTMTPEGLSSTVGSLSNSMGSLAQVATFGPAETMGANAQQALQASYAYTGYLRAMERDAGREPDGGMMTDAMRTEGDIRGSERLGRQTGHKRLADHLGTTPGELAQRKGEFETASTAALSAATGGNVEDAADMYTTEHVIGLERASVLAKGDPQKVGAMKGVNELIETEATENALNAFGQDAMVDGRTAGKATEATIGQLRASQPGGVVGASREVATQQEAERVAAARIAGGVAKMLGLNPDSFLDRLDVSKRRQGLVSMALDTPDQKRALAEAGLHSGNLTPGQAQELMALDGPARAEFAITENGTLGALRFSTASNVASGAQVDRNSGTTDRKGNIVERGDRVTVGDDPNVRSPVMFGGTKWGDIERTAGDIRYLMGDNFDKGVLPDDLRDRLAHIYSERAKEEGRTLRADNVQASLTTFSAGGDVNVRTGAATPIGGSGNMGLQHNEQWDASHTAGADAFTTGMREAIDKNWAEANAITEKNYGSRDSWNEETRTEMLKRFSAANEADFQRLVGVAVDGTAGVEASAQGHNPLADKWEALKSEVDSWF